MEATPLPFLHAIETLKHLPRTGWLRTVQNPESVAAHSFRVAILAMLAPENLNLDRAKCIQMALIHDLAESVIGDIPTFAGYLESLLQVYNPERAKEISMLWLEYEKGETPEAKWVREMDKFECLVQAHEYEQRTFGQKDLSEFQGLSAKVHSQEAGRWAESLSRERKDHLAKRKQRLPIIFITGDVDTSEKIARYTSTALSLPHISVTQILREKAKDVKYPHHTIIQNCLDKGFDVPAGLPVGLLEDEITALDGRPWSIISGFPNDTEQLAEFEKKVQNSNFAFYVECTPYTDNPPLDGAMHTWRSSAVDFKKNLESSAAYFELIGSTTEQRTVSEEELCEVVVKSVKDLIAHANAHGEENP
ncbi:hypothetical protein NUU61_007253 [Penicillium alfredii]|uniref:5'-deoxynucleotidase n=1 Tax=Penicillium alfredii TaxID=1506179 RepID=A0A9W9K432_9EURO|nr:uncharacterized protein NUU61_007253 [Penicillium alfredii]KAJ5092383.1 hypothetical protein NUU61_007253 [Penicillium alfredii]